MHPYGSLTVQQVIQKSSNIGTAKIANKLGPARLDQYLRDFGFGGKTGVNLAGESSGLLRMSPRPVPSSTGSPWPSARECRSPLANDHGHVCHG